MDWELVERRTEYSLQNLWIHQRFLSRFRRKNYATLRWSIRALELILAAGFSENMRVSIFRQQMPLRSSTHFVSVLWFMLKYAHNCSMHLKTEIGFHLFKLREIQENISDWVSDRQLPVVTGFFFTKCHYISRASRFFRPLPVMKTSRHRHRSHPRSLRLLSLSLSLHYVQLCHRHRRHITKCNSISASMFAAIWTAASCLWVRLLHAEEMAFT